MNIERSLPFQSRGAPAQSCRVVEGGLTRLKATSRINALSPRSAISLALFIHSMGHHRLKLLLYSVDSLAHNHHHVGWVENWCAQSFEVRRHSPHASYETPQEPANPPPPLRCPPGRSPIPTSTRPPMPAVRTGTRSCARVRTYVRVCTVIFRRTRSEHVPRGAALHRAGRSRQRGRVPVDQGRRHRRGRGRGGGIPHSAIPFIWTYKYTTMEGQGIDQDSHTVISAPRWGGLGMDSRCRGCMRDIWAGI
ncbi:hypothetical protein B0H14DRAFT_1213650 [Mycena olivaceomarginata]|nr:hypothetical protein B0H14DRAFT_1213650 [Mycena olivaceomarginata]